GRRHLHPPRDGLREPARVHLGAERHGRPHPGVPRVPGRLELPLRAQQLQPLPVVSGPHALHAADITVPDLRGGFSYLIAALGAEGTSTIRGIDLIDRGYESFREKLSALGAEYWEEG